MAAFTARQHNLDLQRVFLQSKAAGKRHKIVLAAIMCKLVVLANVLLRNTRPSAEAAPEARGL